jgi:hypothetical protein
MDEEIVGHNDAHTQNHTASTTPPRRGRGRAQYLKHTRQGCIVLRLSAAAAVVFSLTFLTHFSLFLALGLQLQLGAMGICCLLRSCGRLAGRLYLIYIYIFLIYIGKTGRLLLVLGVQPGRGYFFARRGGGGTAADGSKSPSRLGAVVHSRLIPCPPPHSSRPPGVLSPHPQTPCTRDRGVVYLISHYFKTYFWFHGARAS